MEFKFIVTHKCAFGGFWDGQRVVREIEVTSPEEAAKLEQEGHTVQRVSQSVDLSGMNLAELRAFADERGIDLAGTKTKAQVLAKIEAEQH